MRPEFISLLLLSLIAVSRLQTGGDPTPFLAYIVLLLGVLWLQRTRVRRRRDFVQQLKSCRKELRAGGTVVIDHHLVRYRSEIATYKMNVGGVLCSVCVPSPYRVVDAGDEHHDSLVCSLASLLFGWWSIPGGPIQTLSHIVQNISGGERQTVAELIDLPLLSRIETRRAAIEAHRAEGAAASAAIPVPAAHGDAGPESRVNFELLRGSAGYAEAAKSVGWSRRQAVNELADIPPGPLWIEAAKARFFGSVRGLKARADLRRENRTKHDSLVDRKTAHHAVRP